MSSFSSYLRIFLIILVEQSISDLQFVNYQGTSQEYYVTFRVDGQTGGCTISNIYIRGNFGRTTWTAYSHTHDEPSWGYRYAWDYGAVPYEYQFGLPIDVWIVNSNGDNIYSYGVITNFDWDYRFYSGKELCPTPPPTPQPTPNPTSQPTPQPTFQPVTPQPTPNPTSQPTSQPTIQPTVQPTAQPTSNPTPQPTDNPTIQPTPQPTVQPNDNPTPQPTVQPTLQPTTQPTDNPTSQPTSNPTTQPTVQPTPQPTIQPTPQPTAPPTNNPTSQPTNNPSVQPTAQPTIQPNDNPTSQPTFNPTTQPTDNPTVQPTSNPTSQPTDNPSINPSKTPSANPTNIPTDYPTEIPSNIPTNAPITTTNGGSGEVGDKSTTESNGNQQPASAFNYQDNQLFLWILIGIIGLLILCICILIIWIRRCKKKQQHVQVDFKGMEMARVISVSSVDPDYDGVDGNGTGGNVDTADGNVHTGDGGVATGDGNVDTGNQIQPGSDDRNAFLADQNQIKANVSVPDMNGDMNVGVYWSDDMALKMWLNSINLPQYYDIFVKQGFSEQMSTLNTLNDSDLQSMGIVKMAHKKAILNRIANMQQIQKRVGYEGGAVKDTTTELVNDLNLPDEKVDSDGDDNNVQDQQQQQQQQVTVGGPGTSMLPPKIGDDDQYEYYYDDVNNDENDENDDDDDYDNMYKKGDPNHQAQTSKGDD